MKRNIDRWRGCDPTAMARQSEAAIVYAFEDARSDILALHAALHALYDRRTPETMAQARQAMAAER